MYLASKHARNMLKGPSFSSLAHQSRISLIRSRLSSSFAVNADFHPGDIEVATTQTLRSLDTIATPISPSVSASQKILEPSTFLEDVSGEYGYDDKDEGRRIAMESLLNAVQQLDIQSAARIRRSLLDSGFTITPHPSFASLALHILTARLENSLLGDEFRASTIDISDVLEWWTLVPDAHQADVSQEASELCQILSSDHISITDCRRGGTLIAQKGYVGQVKSLIPRIVRFSRLEESGQFIAQVNGVDIAMWGAGKTEKWENLDGAESEGAELPSIAMYGVNVQGNVRRRIAGRLNLAARTHAFCGRPRESSQLLLQTIEILPQHVGLFTYLVVLESLSSPQYASTFQEIKSHAHRTLQGQDVALLDYLHRHNRIMLLSGTIQLRLGPQYLPSTRSSSGQQSGPAHADPPFVK